MIKPPDNIQPIKGEIADYWYAPDGILYSYSKNPKRTLNNITENIALVKSVTNNKIIPLLIYLSDSPIPDKATRKFAAEQLPNVYKAMALVSKPGHSKLKPPAFPMKSFTYDKQAIEWLTQFV